MSIPPPGPLAYEGDVTVPYINRTFSPLPTNNDFLVPTLWTNTAAKSAFLLTAKPLGVANWLNLGGSTSAPLVSLTGDTGGAIFGDPNQNINILGTAGQIVVTGAGNTLTLSLSGGAGLTWSDQGTNFAAASFNGYFITASCIATLPATPANGDLIAFYVDYTPGSLFTITANTGQTIRFAATASASAGTAVNTMGGDSMLLVYRSTNTRWECISGVGAWTIT